MMTFSEFGRRGARERQQGHRPRLGAPMFLVGGKVKAGVVGEHPSLTKLEDGNLIHATDFRQVYAAVLDQLARRATQGRAGRGVQAGGGVRETELSFPLLRDCWGAGT